MKVFLDTNVLVSAFATRGLCADLYRHVMVEQELVVGEVVLTELRRILRERLKVPAQDVAKIEASLREHTVVPRPQQHLAIGLKDSDDEWVVASAVAGGADILVTGDAELLAQASPPVRITNPRGLWDMIREIKPT